MKGWFILCLVFLPSIIYAQWWLLPAGHQGSGTNSNVINHDISQANQEYIDPKLCKLELLLGDDLHGVQVNKRAIKKRIELLDNERKATLDSIKISGNLTQLTSCLACEGYGIAFCANCMYGLVECGMCNGKG